jgi:3-hydroxyisobutyrate dehydrogenase-like beta-hydroxyacid dehydrogenase
MSRRVAEEHARHQQGYVAAPVLGNPDLARERKLFVLAGGSPSTVEKVRPLLERLGQRLFVIAGHAELANLVKLAANALPRPRSNVWGRFWHFWKKAGLTAILPLTC